MTIDGAIECAELMSRNMVLFDFDNDEDRCEFGMICADALHLMKTLGEKTKLGSEPNELDPDTNTWQEHMKREYHETKERYEKLNRLLVKHAAGTLDFTLKCPIELLKAQREHMSDYLYTLEIRAEIEGVNLYD